MVNKKELPPTHEGVERSKTMYEQYKRTLDKMQESHAKNVLRHMLDFGSITSMEAFAEYGNTRLSATVYVLKNTYNTPIECETKYSTNRYGHRIHYGEYRIVKEQNND